MQFEQSNAIGDTLREASSGTVVLLPNHEEEFFVVI